MCKYSVWAWKAAVSPCQRVRGSLTCGREQNVRGYLITNHCGSTSRRGQPTCNNYSHLDNSQLSCLPQVLSYGDQQQPEQTICIRRPGPLQVSLRIFLSKPCETALLTIVSKAAAYRPYPCLSIRGLCRARPLLCNSPLRTFYLSQIDRVPLRSAR
jgi:hypothetical protein